MFKEIFGESPQAKILDFLGDHPNYDYNVSDLAEYAGVSVVIDPEVKGYVTASLKDVLDYLRQFNGTESNGA